MKKVYLVFFIILSSTSVFSKNYTLKGRILEKSSKTPYDSPINISIPELKKIIRSDENGKFFIQFEHGGNQIELILSGAGIAKTRIFVTLNNLKTETTLLVEARKIKGRSIRIQGTRFPDTSKKSLTIGEIKNVPFSFGDPLSSASTLPGIGRSSNGFLGPLIFRGAKFQGNKYFVDDIPILYPQHLGGAHFTLSSDTIESFNIFSSGYSAKYAQAYSGVIDITTKETVQDFGGVFDMSFLYASLYLEGTYPTSKKEEPVIHSIAAIRAAYFPLVIEPIIEAITGEPPSAPQYYDYQIKMKLHLDSERKHTMKFLILANYDILNQDTSQFSEKQKKRQREEGRDPLRFGSILKLKIFTQNQALFYEYRLNKSLSNTFFIYGAYNYSTLYLNYPGVAGFDISDRSISYNSYPHSLGLKNKFKWNYDIHNLEVGMRYELFFLDYTGQSSLGLKDTDLATPSDPIAFDANTKNHVWGSYLENKIQLSNLSIKPAVRLDYLLSNQNIAWGASLSAQYDFESDTTMFTSASLHESFPQTNYSYFFYFLQGGESLEIDIAKANYLKPERAVHTLLGLKQFFGDIYSLQIEGFHNLFNRLVRRVGSEYGNDAETQNTGIEITLKKELEEKDFDYYGWISYTYLDANLKVNSLNNFVPYNFEQEHALKFILGFKIYRFEIAFRFQLYSGLPYTPIIGSQNRIQNRYAPVFGDQNSGRFKPFHSLDFRFSSNIFTSTSKIRSYFEVYNLYNFRAENNLEWNYSRPFQQGQNPKLSSQAVIPGSQQNLLFVGGVEVQF